LDRKEELKKKLAINSFKNHIKENLSSFTLVKIYEHSEAEFAYYAEKIKDFRQFINAGELNEKINHIGNSHEHYYEWILSEIPTINDFDKWLVTSRDSRGYWAEVKAGSRFDSIRELWHEDKKSDGQIGGYSLGFFAINTSINMIIDVHCYLGGQDRGYNSEDYFTLSTLKI